jgi:CheY-like chemotaxis protein
MDTPGSKVDILLVEDNPADIRLMLEILKEGEIPNNFHVTTDGEEAMAYLRREPPYDGSPRPDIIFLDLNLPKKDGREVLKEIKGDPGLRRIPVVVMTTSEAPEDIATVYDHSANCFITKPVDLDDFVKVVQVIKGFWLSLVKLPRE